MKCYKYLLGIYYMLGSILSTWDILGNKHRFLPCGVYLYSSRGRYNTYINLLKGDKCFGKKEKVGQSKKQLGEWG